MRKIFIIISLLILTANFCCAQTTTLYFPQGTDEESCIYSLTATVIQNTQECSIECDIEPEIPTTLEIPSTVMFGNTECTVTEIATSAFEGINKFVGDLYLPTTIVNIESFAFRNCTGFDGTLYLPDGVLVKNQVFTKCNNFTSIVVRDGVKIDKNNSMGTGNDYPNLKTLYVFGDPNEIQGKFGQWVRDMLVNPSNNLTVITPENMNNIVTTPTFNPKAGAYTGSFNVTISCATDRATIYYTTDGTDPTTSTSRKTYTEPITVNENTTIKAYAVKEGLTPIHSQATYTIINSINPPAFSPVEGTYTNAQSVSLTSEGATIYYTTDGSDPTTTSTSRKTYSGEVQIDGETNIKAVAFKDNQYSSVSTALYHFHVETPTFSPETNTIIEDGELEVKLKSDTEGATIYYTTNGDTPTTESTPYTVPITVNENTTIKAYAVKNGYEDSYVATAFYSEKKIVLTPTLSPAGGTFTGSISVTISGEEGATIYYTTNGDTPTVGSTKYESSITLSEPTIIKAIAYKDGMTESQVATGEYKFYLPAPTFSVASGTYNTVQNVEINSTTKGATIHYTTNGDTPTTSSATYSQPIAVNKNTTIKAIAVKEDWKNSSFAEAEYTLKVPAITYTPDPSEQFDEETTVTLTCEGATIYCTIDSTDPTNELTPYTNSITVTVTKTTNIKAIAVRDGWEDSDMIDLWYKKFITVGEPVFNPDNNQALLETTDIEITCTVPNQEDQVYKPTIYYTLDGSDPTTEYTGPISISGPTTIKAYGMVNDHDNIANSPVITKKYDFKVAQPTITAGGSFTSQQTVTIGCTTYGATIHYTTNGDTPTTSSAPYSQPIAVNKNTTIKAIAVKEGWISSDVVEATYEFNVESPSITPSCTFEYGESITISLSSNTNGSTIHYTTDGSDPTPESAICNGKITLNETKTIKAIACKEEWNSSQIVSATFTEMDVVSTPILSLTPGKYNTIKECIVECATEGATIYYSINGSDYMKIENNTTIDITQSTSISAYAVKEGMTKSPIISETYTLEAPMPTFEPKGAKYTESQNVTISTKMDATIYYTTNGEVPTNASTPYTGPISISEPTTINAIAYIEGWEMSQVVTEIYDFYEKVANPVISPESGNSTEDINVTISCVEGAKIYYTINGNEPDIYNNNNNNNNYTFVYDANTTTIIAQPTETTIIKAIAVKDGMLPSDIITANYNDNAILTFTGNGSWYTAENWNRGYVPSSKARVAISGDLVISSNETVNVYYINNVGSGYFEEGTITIKDGGQLIYNTADIEDVKIEKEIIGYGNYPETQQGMYGWYAFSTPISGTINNTTYQDLIPTNNNYDLFSFNESDWHWYNYKTGKFTSINLGQGYLYANSENTTIISIGTPNNNAISFTLSAHTPELEDNVQGYDLTGFNLIGNPFTFNIGKGDGQAIDTDLLKDGYYVLTTNGKWTPVDNSEQPIKVGTSIFVETKNGINDNNKNIIIDNIPYTAAQQQGSKRGMSESESLSITVSNDKYDDIAYIHFGNDTKNGLRKLAHMNEDIQMVYVPINGIYYAIANVDKNIREVPVAFETSTMGKYTISVDASKCSHEEIYLLDNLTNEKIDILDKDYTFIATSSENKERFSLLFIDNNDESSDSNIIETFAYICNGEIVIDNIEGSGNVYVYDIMGRPIITRKANENVNIPTGSLTGGIYIICLIDDNGIKTQKIIIK